MKIKQYNFFSNAFIRIQQHILKRNIYISFSIKNVCAHHHRIIYCVYALLLLYTYRTDFYPRGPKTSRRCF